MSLGVRLVGPGRGMGTRLVGAKGSGKSRLLARAICYQDLRAGRPVVLIDPVGRTIDELLDKVLRQNKRTAEKLLARIRYLDVGGGFGFVTPLSVYHRSEGEALYDVSQRPLDVWRRIDPALAGAPILGLNAVLNTGTFTGMALAAMSEGLAHAEALLSDPSRFGSRLVAAAKDEPEADPAVRWLLTQMPKPGTSAWRNEVGSYLNKVRSLTLNAAARATYATATPAFRWEDVLEQNLCVLVDFRGVVHEEPKRFGLVWVFRSLIEAVKRRGPGKHTPLSLVIDELTYLLSHNRQQQDALADDFEELVARLARNHGVWLTVSHQELNQLSPRIGDVLMACGNQIFGSTADLEGGAQAWSKRFTRYDPYKVKKAINVADPLRDLFPDIRTEEFTIQEQFLMAAQEKYMDLPAFSFWAAISPREGVLGSTPRRFSIRRLDEGRWVDEAIVVRLRRRLARRDGVCIADLLTPGPSPAAAVAMAEHHLVDAPPQLT